MSEPVTHTIAVGDARIEAVVWGDGVPEVVFLHDGLGSVGQWRGVPADVARRSGLTVMAYDRPGHGASTPVPAGPWPADWLHREAVRLRELVIAMDIDRPRLVGHSDGGSIALLHAAERPEEVDRVMSLAAHSWVEQVCFDAIAGMAASPHRFVTGLARHHQHPEAVFEAWSGVWTSDAFRTWDIRAMLASVTAPTLVVQGEGDEYATDAQAIETANAIGANATCRLLPGLGHLLHHEDPALVADLVVDWVG